MQRPRWPTARSSRHPHYRHCSIFAKPGFISARISSFATRQGARSTRERIIPAASLSFHSPPTMRGDNNPRQPPAVAYVQDLHHLSGEALAVDATVLFLATFNAAVRCFTASAAAAV